MARIVPIDKQLIANGPVTIRFGGGEPRAFNLIDGQEHPVTFTRSGDVHRVEPAPPRPPCKFLGEATGVNHKLSCGTSHEFAAEHFCLHPERPAKVSKRTGAEIKPKCLPMGDCKHLLQIAWPCVRCELWEAAG